MLERRERGRQRILEGAAQILDSGLLADFTVDNLARSLHMSKSTLYKYFDSKDDVVACLVSGACSETERELDTVELGDTTTAIAALERLVGVIAHHADRTPGAILLQARELPGAVSSRVERIHAMFHARVEEVMSRGARAGEFDVPSPRIAAASYLAALDEAVATVARSADGMSRGDALRAVHLMVAHGFAHA